VRTNNARKKAKADDALAIFMFQAFVINKSNLLVKDGPQQLLISWLFFFSMRKKQVEFFQGSIAQQELL
jgi:hypothetical protein